MFFIKNEDGGKYERQRIKKKIGNKWAIIIPNEILERMNINAEEDLLSLRIENKELLIEKFQAKKRPAKPVK